MKALATIAGGFSRWIDVVAETVVSLLGWFAMPRTIKLLEDGNGEFVVHACDQLTDPGLIGQRMRMVEGRIVDALPAEALKSLVGSRVEVVMQPDRFLFRTLELPGRAVEFLSGIVRTQIDRLMPWGAADAAFGWSKPVEPEPDRMVTTVAGTTLQGLRPYVQALAGLGVQSVVVFARCPETGPDAVPIKVLEEKTHRVSELGRIRRVLVNTIAATGLAAAAAVGACVIIGAGLEARQDELARQIARARVAAVSASNAALGSVEAAQRILERRKYDAPPNVIVLEELSKILPDHTYLTELRIEGNKLRLIGITRDAPSLIELIEQSAHFKRATFFAPTTRAASDSNERFHIEAQIQPLVSPRT